MPNPIHVPDIPGPRKQLCWRQAPATLARCDRCLGHGGLHTWEWAAITTALVEAETEVAALKGRTCETCRHRFTPERDPDDACALTSDEPGRLTYTWCKSLGNTCGAWKPKEQP